MVTKIELLVDEASAATASPEGYRFLRAFSAAAGQLVTELFTDVSERD